MRGRDHQSGHLGGYVIPAGMVPPDHPLRQIRPLVNAALARLSPDFDQLYSLTGRPSIPPEQLLGALLLQAFFTVRSERQLVEQLTYNILFRWFVGLSIEAPVWDVTVFTKNRDRLLEGDIAHGFLRAILADPQVKRRLSSEHFSVDGTLIEAWASMKSFRPKHGSGEPPGPGRNGARDFHGETRSNDMHGSTRRPRGRQRSSATWGRVLASDAELWIKNDRFCTIAQQRIAWVLSLSASSCRAQNSSKSSDRGCAGQRHTLDPKPTSTQLP